MIWYLSEEDSLNISFVLETAEYNCSLMERPLCLAQRHFHRGNKLNARYALSLPIRSITFRSKAQSFMSKPNSEAVMSITITARFFYIINMNLYTILELKRKLVFQEKKEIERLLCYEMLNSLLSLTVSLRTGSPSRCSRSCP